MPGARKTKTVRVDEDTHRELHELKFDLRLESLGDVLEHLVEHFRKSEKR